MGNLRVPLIRLSIAGALIAAAGWPTHSPAGVLGEHITPYATLSSSYDSNLFLLSEDVESDVITRVTAGVDANLEISRQRFLLQAQANRDWFSRFDFLNYTGGKGALQWDWVLGEQWTGKLGYLYERTRTGFSQFRAINSDLDLLTQQTAIAEGDYKLHPRWEIRTGFDWRSFAHSLDVNKPSDLEIYSGTLGLHYRTQKGPSIGTQAVMRVAEYPNRPFPDPANWTMPLFNRE